MIIKTFMKSLLIVAIASCFAFGQARKSRNAQVNSPELEIEKLEQQRLNAYLKLDASALERIMSDDYTSVYADGQVVTKAQELEGVKSAPAGVLSSLSAKIDQISVRQFGAAALLSGRLIIKGTIRWSQKQININAAFR